MNETTRTITIGNHRVDVSCAHRWQPIAWRVIVDDIREAWEYEQRKPCAHRRTMSSVAQSMVNFYECGFTARQEIER